MGETGRATADWPRLHCNIYCLDDQGHTALLLTVLANKDEAAVQFSVVELGDGALCVLNKAKPCSCVAEISVHMHHANSTWKFYKDVNGLTASASYSRNKVHF
jgi:hypothetical protein